MDENINVVGNYSYVDQTLVHPLGLFAILLLGIMLFFVSRRWAVLPILIMACFVSCAQRLVIFGVDFSLLRFMAMFGWFRVLIKKEYISFVWKPLDKAIVLWVFCSILFFSLREQSLSAFVNRLGFAYNSVGMYFLFRCWIRDWRDVDNVISSFIWISIPLALFFVFEWLTRRNIFSIFGGVPQFTAIRDGRLRCQGAFSHAILAGCFWASIIPIIAASWFRSKEYHIRAIVGVLCSLIIIFCCASSTPLMGVVFAGIGGLVFLFRYHMKRIVWCILLMLICLHMVMKAPVWHLISRINVVGGSTGWHRYNLINQAIIHFSDWWFWGCSGLTIANWGVFGGDVTNQYIYEGVMGGVLTLGLFITVIIVAFRDIGCLWRSHIDNLYRLVLSWALGVSLFVHCVNFSGVSYFGQIFVVLYLLLAIIGSISTNRTIILTHSVTKPPKVKMLRCSKENTTTCQR